MYTAEIPLTEYVATYNYNNTQCSYCHPSSKIGHLARIEQRHVQVELITEKMQITAILQAIITGLTLIDCA